MNLCILFGFVNAEKGLSARQVASSDEIQLRIDPMHGDLDDEITGLRKQVRQLRNVSFFFSSSSSILLVNY